MISTLLGNEGALLGCFGAALGAVFVAAKNGLSGFRPNCEVSGTRGGVVLASGDPNETRLVFPVEPGAMRNFAISCLSAGAICSATLGSIVRGAGGIICSSWAGAFHCDGMVEENESEAGGRSFSADGMVALVWSSHDKWSARLLRVILDDHGLETIHRRSWWETYATRDRSDCVSVKSRRTRQAVD